MELRTFVDYDRISDVLMFFNNDTTLEFVVVLSAKDKAGNRSFFHSEYDYESDKYFGIDQGHSIKRRMTFYFSINDKKTRSFVIRPEDSIMLTMLIESQVLPWYFDPKRKIFSIIEGQLRIVGTYKPVVFAHNDISYLRLIPCVYQFEDNTYKEGIRMYVSSETTFVDMEIDKFLSLFYFISRTDMYSVATNMVTYVKTPPYGVNTYSISNTGLGGANRPSMPRDFDLVEQETKEEKKMNDFFNRVNKKK